MTTVAELFALASDIQQSGNLNGAAELYHQIVQADPRQAEAHFKLGNILLRQHKLDEAITRYRLCIDLRPNDAEAHCNLGLALASLGKLDDAVKQFSRALSLNPRYAEAHSNLGTALRSQRKQEEAIASFQQALVCNPNFAEAHYNLGNAFKDMARWDEAADQYQQALRLKPGSANAHNNLAIVYQSQDRFADAARHYREALRLNPNHAEANRNLGIILQQEGKFADAAALYKQAILVRPDFAEAHHDLAMLCLLQGDFERGWPEYEMRWKLPQSGGRSFPQPFWDGSALNGRTILLHAEQGLGDTLHFIRYAQLVKQHGGHVVVECQPRLEPLLTGVAGIDLLVPRGAPLPKCDVHAPLLSLPNIFKTTIGTIPNNVPYLHADDKLVERWLGELNASGQAFRVGIAWQGNAAFRGDKHRSIPLTSFAPLSRVPEVQLISLQKGPGTTQLAGLGQLFPIIDLGRDVDETAGAFVDTAAIMKHLDLVVCSDSAIAHLAGGLGVPVWVALPFVPDWRWLLEREDSPWYPTMRLFRQKKFGCWEEVFERMADALRQINQPNPPEGMPSSNFN
jgi:tetratricopeptide (TPR) repeat protein